MYVCMYVCIHIFLCRMMVGVFELLNFELVLGLFFNHVNTYRIDQLILLQIFTIKTNCFLLSYFQLPMILPVIKTLTVTTIELNYYYY
jgi:hypothetical protein